MHLILQLSINLFTNKYVLFFLIANLTLIIYDNWIFLTLVNVYFHLFFIQFLQFILKVNMFKYKLYIINIQYLFEIIFHI